MRRSYSVAMTRFNNARMKLYELEGHYKIFQRLGCHGDHCEVRKVLSYHGGFDIDLLGIMLVGPGPNQLDWSRHIEDCHKVNRWSWGTLRCADPGNLCYDSMMRIILADWPKSARLCRGGIFQGTIAHLNQEHVGDVLEAILACYLFLQNADLIHLSSEERKMRIELCPLVLDIGPPSALKEYGMVLHEIYALLKHFMRSFGISQCARQWHVHSLNAVLQL